jgi:hypothetical protein
MRVYTLGYTRWWKSIIGFVRHDALAASYQDTRYMARRRNQIAILGPRPGRLLLQEGEILLQNCSGLYRSSSFTRIQSVLLAWYAPFRFWYGISGLVEVVDELIHCSKTSGVIISSAYSSSIAQRRMVVGKFFS